MSFPETVRLVAEIGDEMVGFVIGDRHRRQGEGWIATIGVHPDHRRQGIGGALLAACERALETPIVRLTLRVSNRIALNLYRKAGYRQVELWRGYYRSGEDGLVMEKDLRSGAAGADEGND